MQTGSWLTGKVVHTCHATSVEVCYIYKARNELVHSVLRLSFPVYNSLIQSIDLYYTLIGYFRALHQIYRSLEVDIGRGGSRAQFEVQMTNKI